MNWIINISLSFVLAILLSGIVIPQILLISFRKKLFDKPNIRKIHSSTVPRLGGIAFVPVILFTMALLLGVNISLGNNDLLSSISDDAIAWTYGFCALLLLYVIGMADDLIGVRYRAKFVVQAICAIMIIAGGLGLYTLDGLFFVYYMPSWISCLITILAIVFITNAINLIDGIDGLASGLSGVALAFYAILFYTSGCYAYCMLAITALGVLIQFFYYNVFGSSAKRTKIFMGDTGSLTIGILLCIMSLKVMNTPDVYFQRPLNNFILAFSPLIIPCFDVLRVYFYRIRHGRSPFLPDKNHIHHRLMALGWSQRRTMVIILSVSVGITIMNILLSLCININLIFVIDIALWLSGIYLISFTLRKKGIPQADFTY